MENRKNMIFENNKFVYFTRPDSIKTYLNKNNIEKKKLPFDKSFSWKNINKDNYKEFVNENDKTFIIITGKESNVTVIDFVDAEDYDALLKAYPILKDHFTVKTKRGYHIYFRYEPKIITTSNVVIIMMVLIPEMMVV
jgi:hypothetical protein